jgi:thioredoxin 1
MSVLKLTDENFENEVLNSDKVCLVDFYADWCGPCKMLSPIMDEISKDYDVYKVNVDEESELTQSFGIMSIPCVIFFQNGEEINRLIGLHSKSEFMEKLK